MKTNTRAATALALALAAAAAHAEPGTPSKVEAREWGRTLVDSKPAIDILFTGWNQKARFFVAITRDGQPWTPYREHIGDSPRCDYRLRGSFVEQYHCIRPADPTKSADQNWVDKPGKDGYAIHFRELDWDSEFCFRLMAQDDHGEYAKAWTGWACARTRSAPPLPTAPSIQKITGLPGSSGLGVVGEGTPSRLLIEWAPGAANAAKLVVEKAPLVADARFQPVVPDWRQEPLLEKRELVLDHALNLEQAVQFRVCGENVMGRTCSAPKRFPPRDLKENAVAVELPKHGPAPMTSSYGVEKGPRAVPTPVPLTVSQASVTTPQPLSPKVGAASAPPIRVREIRQAPSAFGR